MRINCTGLAEKYPELQRFIDASTDEERINTLKKLKPHYKLKCDDRVQKNTLNCDFFSGEFQLTPLIIITELGLLDHLKVILNHNKRVTYSHLLYPSIPCTLNRYISFYPTEKVDETVISSSHWHNDHTKKPITIIVADGFFALRVAARKGYLDIMQSLLTVPEYAKSVDCYKNIILKTAAEVGHEAVVSYLIELPKIQTHLHLKDDPEIFHSALLSASPAILELLLASSRQQEYVRYLIYALETGKEEYALRMLQSEQVRNDLKQSADNHYVLWSAIDNQQWQFVDQFLALGSLLLTQNNRVLYTAIHAAIKTKNIDIVTRLLDAPGVREKAAAEKNQALVVAAAKGHLDIAKKLLDITEVANNVPKNCHNVLRAALMGPSFLSYGKWKIGDPHEEMINLILMYYPTKPYSNSFRSALQLVAQDIEEIICRYNLGPGERLAYSYDCKHDVYDVYRPHCPPNAEIVHPFKIERSINIGGCSIS